MCSNRVSIICICLSFIPLSTTQSSGQHRSPIILVPGLGGSRLQNTLNKVSRVSFLCERNTNGKFTLLWMDVKQLTPLMISCWVDNMKLNYNSLENRTFNQLGVYSIVQDFGNPEMVEYLNPKYHHLGAAYFNKMVEELLQQGYTRKKNLFAAPYDFRKGPSELNYFFNDLHKLIEYAYNINNAPVILIAHSMGSLMSLNFLQNKTNQWKKKYIRATITLGAPYGGSVKALKTFAAGDNLASFVFDPQVMKKVLSTMPSLAYLLPTKQVWGNEVLVSTVDKNYNLNNLKEFFDDIGIPNGWKMYLNERKFSNNLSPPGVEWYCFQGSGIETISRLNYFTKESFPNDPKMSYETGDGTVALRSLQYCESWRTKQLEKVETKSFPGVNHMEIIRNKEVLQYIMKAVQELSMIQGNYLRNKLHKNVKGHFKRKNKRG